jgi:predicted nucleic acid-binding protein
LIAVDTSAFARYLAGFEDRTTEAVLNALRFKGAALPPIVVAELLSNPALPESTRLDVIQLPRLPIRERYWENAGELRAHLVRDGLKAKLADCLIAQSCIDNDAPLITYDRDFRHFERAGLRVI